jgi:hypothetical protein
MLLKTIQQQKIKEEKKPNAFTLQTDPVNFLLPSYSYPKPEMLSACISLNSLKNEKTVNITKL